VSRDDSAVVGEGAGRQFASEAGLALLQVPVASHFDREVCPLRVRPLPHLRMPRIVGPLQRLAAQRLTGAPLLLQLSRFEALSLSHGQGVETAGRSIGPLVDHPR